MTMILQNTLDSVLSTTSKSFRLVKIEESDEEGHYQQFHARFWGQKIEDSAQSWLDSLSTDKRKELGLQGDPSLWGNAAEDRMGVDADHNSDSLPVDEEDDLLKGCLVLDLDFMRGSMKKIWVRADYIRMYNACEERFLKKRINRVLITGQPGIGKTVWLQYAARRRAGERKPFIWDRGGVPYLFVEEGVFKILKHTWSSLRQALWVLVDSDPQGSANAYLSRFGPTFVVCTSPPDQELWKSCYKTGDAARFIMQPWFRRELRRSARLDLFPDVDESQAMDIVQQLGPIPRLLTDRYRRPYLQSLKSVIGNLTAMDIKASGAYALDRNDISQKIIVVSRSSREDVASDTKGSIVSDTVSTDLGFRLRSLKMSQQVALYHHLSSNRLKSAAAGCVYEANIMQQLSNGLTLRLAPIIKPSSSSSDTCRSWWQSPHHHPFHITIEEQLDLRPEGIQQFSSIPKLPVLPNTVYIPTLSDQPPQNPFFVLDNAIYFFQMTIAAKHNINTNLLDFATKLGFEAKDRRFIFITPTHSPLSVPFPSDHFLRDMDVFVAELDVSA